MGQFFFFPNGFTLLFKGLIAFLFQQDVGMPADYINKLARMFQDIKVSNDLNQGFKKEYQNKGDIAGKYGCQPWSFL